MLFYINLAIS